MIRARRATYFALAGSTILVGLLVHLRGDALPPAARDIAGDALWAAMMVWWVGVVFPVVSPWWRAAIAYAVCVAVETSQLLHAAWLDALRATTSGHLVLGSDFDTRDLAAYAGGVLVALLADVAFTKRTTGPRRRWS